MAKAKATRKKKPASRRKKAKARKKATRARRNPRVPVIGDTALALTYKGGEGKRRGEMRGPWIHEFESDDVQVLGLPDGSVKLKSRSGKRLWDVFEVEA